MAVLILCQAGCASHIDRISPVRRAYSRGQLQEASTRLAKLQEKPKEDRDVLMLDQAMIELVSGNPRQAERLLRTVRDRFDYLEQKSGAEVALSMLTDDRKIAYAGEDYEKVLIRSFLAISSLMSGSGDAEAYSLQIAAKQQELIEKANTEETPYPELSQHQVALGPYLRAMLQEESRTNADEVVRNRAMVASFNPQFRDAKVDLARAESAAPCPPGHGVVYVLALVGNGPVKEEKFEVPTQIAMLLADRIISAIGKQNLTPTLAPIRVPVVVRKSSQVDNVKVSLDSRPMGETATLVDVGNMAVAYYEPKKNQVLARAVTRRALKKGVMYIAKEGAAAHTAPGVDLLLTLAGVAWEASEIPDTRSWALLPDQIQVLRMEVPVGEHEIALTPASRSQYQLAPPQSIRVRVHEGRNTTLLVNVPESQIVGQILSSDSPQSAAPSDIQLISGP